MHTFVGFFIQGAWVISMERVVTELNNGFFIYWSAYLLLVRAKNNIWEPSDLSMESKPMKVFDLNVGPIDQSYDTFKIGDLCFDSRLGQSLRSFSNIIQRIKY